MATTDKGIWYPDPSTPMSIEAILEQLAESVDGVMPKRGVASVSFSSGLGTLTHGLGVVPAVVFVQARLGTAGVVVAPDGTAPTSTTCGVRAWLATTGGTYSGSLSAVQYLAIA